MGRQWCARLPRRRAVRWRPVAWQALAALAVATCLAAAALGTSSAAAARSKGSASSALSGLAPCNVTWICVYEPAASDTSAALEVDAFRATGVPGVVGPQRGRGCPGNMTFYDSTLPVTCLSFTGLVTLQRGQGVRTRTSCATLSQATWAGQNAAPCSSSQSGAILLSEQLVTSESDAFGYLVYLAVSCAVLALAEWPLLLVAPRVVVFRVELLLTPLSQFMFVLLVALLELVFVATVSVVEPAFGCAGHGASLVGNVSFLGDTTASEPVSELAAAVCPGLRSLVHGAETASVVYAAFIVVLYAAVMLRSQLDQRDIVRFESKHPAAKAAPLASLGRGAGRGCCCCGDCIAIYLILLALTTMVLVVLVGPAFTTFGRRLLRAVGLEASSFPSTADSWAVVTVLYTVVFGYGVACALVVGCISIANRACQERLAKRRGAISSENIAKLITYAVVFLALSVLLSLATFAVGMICFAVAALLYSGCEAPGLVGSALSALTNSLALQERVAQALPGLEETICTTLRSQSLAQLVALVNGLARDLPQTAARPVAISNVTTPELEQACETLVHFYVVNFSALIRNVTTAALASSCIDTPGTDEEQCVDFFSTWCSQNALPTYEAGSTVFLLTMLVHFGLIALLSGLPGLAADASRAVAEEIGASEALLTGTPDTKHGEEHGTQGEDEVSHVQVQIGGGGGGSGGDGSSSISSISSNSSSSRPRGGGGGDGGISAPGNASATQLELAERTAPSSISLARA
jgi:hypothetical protein